MSEFLTSGPIPETQQALAQIERVEEFLIGFAPTSEEMHQPY